MRNDPYDPKAIRVEDQRKDKGRRARKGQDRFERYISAAEKYLTRNPTAEPTAYDEHYDDLFKLEQERAAVAPNFGNPFAKRQERRPDASPLKALIQILLGR